MTHVQPTEVAQRAGRQPCARCGREADYDFGPIWLCLDCYHIAGSTCSGIGATTTGAKPTPTGADPIC